MTGGGTAWLILRRVDPDRVARDSLTAHDTRDGAVLWSVDADGHTNTEHLDFTGPLYAHDFDAGSLAEAKYAVTTVEEREAAQAVDQSADQSTSHTGSAR